MEGEKCKECYFPVLNIMYVTYLYLVAFRYLRFDQKPVCFCQREWFIFNSTVCYTVMGVFLWLYEKGDCLWDYSESTVKLHCEVR